MPEHPDTPERLVAIERALAGRGWLGWERREAPPAREDQLGLIHDRALIERLKEMAIAGGGAIDADTFVGEPSYRAALHAAGGACEMTRALVEDEADVAFCGVRPSGHHAEPGRAMGFCLFNNVAVAAEYAICELGMRRVFILDWDVHHGNGTAETFRRRPDVLFASIHQGGIYPGTGALGDSGSGPGEGYTINLPVPAGSEEDLWLSLLEHVVLPAAVSFEPELVLVSAGFDAHRLRTRWRTAGWRRAPSQRWPDTCATSPSARVPRSARYSREVTNPRRSRSPSARRWRRWAATSRHDHLRPRRS